ncbi:DUF4129 domain-containing protein [Halomarina halobia]|uniref:DUF4129 domain-containing protein n=1 Tax=Halomarina halobia TaxID=3033386 RepID=A0ABD6AFR7_9EURY
MPARERPNVDRLVSAAIALVCVVAVGVSATTLDSSLSSDPEEVIDLDYDRIPLGQEQAREVKEEVERNEQRQERRQQARSGGGGGDSGGGSEEPEPPWWAWLLRLLERLLSYATAALVALVALALGRRYADRLRSLLLALFPGGRADGNAGTDAPVAVPENEVERAWLSMLERAGVEDARTMTTAECARAAVDAGCDPSAVETLRTAYERIRYGGAAITDEDVRRARDSLRRMSGGDAS